MTPIAIDHLTKRYGAQVAVDDLSLHVESGSICGLLGSNGAGKTTTFKCLLGFAHPTSGSVSIEGQPLGPQSFKHLAYVPERPPLYEWMKVRDHLEMQSRAFASYDAKLALDLCGRLGLDKSKRVKRLSKGQQSALSVILAFSIRPTILVLDEPTSGLDPMHQRDVLDLIVEAAAGGTTILFSTHHVAQIERAADRVVMIEGGRAILDANVDDLKAGEKIVEAVLPESISLDALRGSANVRRVERTGSDVRISTRADAGDVVAQLDALGARGTRVVERELEDIFIQAVSDARRTGVAK